MALYPEALICSVDATMPPLATDKALYPVPLNRTFVVENVPPVRRAPSVPLVPNTSGALRRLMT
jgi:hypothetical protein